MVGALCCGEGFLQFQLDTLRCVGMMRQNVENRRRDVKTFAMQITFFILSFVLNQRIS